MFSLPRLIPTIEAEYLERLTKDGPNWLLSEGKSLLSHPNYLEITEYFASSGAKAIQIILQEKELDNISNIKNSHPNLAIIGGGGIRSIDSALNFIKKGSDYVVIGGYLSQNLEELPKYVAALGTHLIVSVDDIDGMLATNRNIKTLVYCEYLAKQHVNTVIYVNEATKLKNQGINIDRFEKIRSIIPTVNLIYSGGISSKKDILELINVGADSMILGTYAYNHCKVFGELV